MELIHISITGKVQTGKSAILQSIKELLEQHNYCVAVPDREMRHNPSANLTNAAAHERPKKDTAVIVLTEHLSA